jgi:hypothetical protein
MEIIMDIGIALIRVVGDPTSTEQMLSKIAACFPGPTTKIYETNQAVSFRKDLLFSEVYPALHLIGIDIVDNDNIIVYTEEGEQQGIRPISKKAMKATEIYDSFASLQHYQDELLNS